MLAFDVSAWGGGIKVIFPSFFTDTIYDAAIGSLALIHLLKNCNRKISMLYKRILVVFYRKTFPCNITSV